LGIGPGPFGLHQNINIGDFLFIANLTSNVFKTIIYKKIPSTNIKININADSVIIKECMQENYSKSAIS
jgi:hypothetical protein